jgi:branched-chain amino acid transport system substrate-binding protein
MKRMTLLLSLVLVLVIALLSLSCATSAPAPTASAPATSAPPKTTAPTSAPAAGEIKLGLIQSQTGMYAGFGVGGVWGIKAAVDDINAAGGVKVGSANMKLVLSIVDDQSDQNKGGPLAENLITQQKVNFLVSGEEPPTMRPSISTIADRYKVPFVASAGPLEPWAGMRKESDTKWPYTWATGMFALGTPAPAGDFRNGKLGYTVDDTWVEYLKQYGAQTNKKVAVFASNDGDGVGWYAGLPNILIPLGYQPIGLDKKLGLLPMDTTDFSTVINEWKSNGCEILWGNSPAPFYGAMWKQARSLGFAPKMVSIGRAPLFYTDVNAWGGELPNGIGVEVWWTPTLKEAQGIGSTTPASLAERWAKEMNQPVNPAIGPGYRVIQVLADAITRAGSIEAEKVQAALKTTDMMSIAHRVKFDENNFNRTPLVFGQWQKVTTPEKWKLEIIYSAHSFIPTTAKPIFPIPY